MRRQNHRQAVHDAVGGGVVRLAAITERRRHRRHQQQALQALRAQLAAQQEGGIGLGVHHAVERFRRLVADELVFDDAGAVYDHVQAAMLACRCRSIKLAEGAFVAHVHRMIFHLGAGAAQIFDALDDFAIFQQALQGGLHRRGLHGGRKQPASGAVRAAFRRGNLGDASRIRGLGSGGQRRGPGQNQRRLIALGKLPRNLGGDAARAAGHQENPIALDLRG